MNALTHEHLSFRCLLENRSGRIDMRQLTEAHGAIQLYIPTKAMRLDDSEAAALAIALLDASGITGLLDDALQGSALLMRLKQLEAALDAANAHITDLLTIWHRLPGSLPDDDRSVLITDSEGDVMPAFHEDGNWFDFTGMPIKAPGLLPVAWTEMPTPAHALTEDATA